MVRENYYRPKLKSSLKTLSDWNYALLFYEADESITLMLHDYGFWFYEILNAAVDLTTFSGRWWHGKKFANRNPIVSKKQASSLSYLILHFQRLMMQEMKAVSDI